MQMSNTCSSNINASNVKLPPISNGSGEGATHNGGGKTEAVNVESAAIKRTDVPGKSQQMIYRSIPPKVQNFTFSDMFDSGLTPNVKAKKPKGAAFTSSSEFAKRFMSRPTTQPKVIEFNAGTVKADKRRRGINGFFPPVKLRVSAKKDFNRKNQISPEDIDDDVTYVSHQKDLSQNSWSSHCFGRENKYCQKDSKAPVQVPSRLQLVPTSYSEVRPRSAKSRSVSRASRNSIRSRPDSIRTAPPGPETLAIYPEAFDCDDLSYLPPPKRILPKRDVPWVFRYKVKRNMNELSKIMASKPPPQMTNA